MRPRAGSACDVQESRKVQECGRCQELQLVTAPDRDASCNGGSGVQAMPGVADADVGGLVQLATEVQECR